MTWPIGSGGPEARASCGFCGYIHMQQFTVCPRCGRPARVQMTQNDQTRPSAPLLSTMGERFGDWPTQPGTNTPAPGAGGAHPYEALTQPGRNPSGYVAGNPSGQMPGAANSAPTSGFGSAPTVGWPNGPTSGASPQAGLYPPGPIGGQAPAAGAPTKPPWSRRKRVSVISAALAALLLVGTVSAYFVYAAFFAYSPTDSARYLPAGTLFYSSFDLQQVAQNSHHVTQDDVSSTTNTSGFEQATGLDFQKDVAPWIKRSFSFSLVAVTRQPASGGLGAQPTFGTVFLVSTHDVNASNAAIQKIITTQEQKYGVKFTTISYQGTTLYSDVDSVQSQQANIFSRPAGRASPLALGIVKDQVVIANTLAIAEQVVDRAQGNGATLAQDATFSAAMEKLPGNRFGTLYLNLRQLLRDLLGTGNATSTSAVTDDYPVGYGSLQFTDAGMRLSLTLEAKAGAHLTYDLNGDTNASAGVVPASAILFAGLGNLNSFYHQAKDASAGLLTDTGFTKALGLGPDDPLFKSPVSLALLPPEAGSDDVIEPLALLHSSLDSATISAKVQQALETLGYKTTASTIQGVTVTAVQASQGVYYAVLGHDLVLGYDTEGISQAINTFQGRLANLAGSPLFKQLVGQAPKNNALTLFASLENLAKAPGELGRVYQQLVKQGGLLAKVTAAYLSYRLDNSGITITEDIALK